MAGQRVGAIHRKIGNQRRDFLHKLSRSLVDDHDLIVIQDLAITNMTRRPAPRPDGHGGFASNRAAAKSGLNKSILDAGWGTLTAMLTYKAEGAGRELVVVNPAIPPRPVPVADWSTGTTGTTPCSDVSAAVTTTMPTSTPR